MVNFRKEEPMLIVSRVLLLEAIKLLKPIEVFKIHPNAVYIVDVEDENQNVSQEYEFDWEYLLFRIYLKPLQEIFFQFKPEEYGNTQEAIDEARAEERELDHSEQAIKPGTPEPHKTTKEIAAEMAEDLGGELIKVPADKGDRVGFVGANTEGEWKEVTMDELGADLERRANMEKVELPPQSLDTGKSKLTDIEED